MTPVDQVDGFVLTKGKSQTLQIAVVHEGTCRRPSAAQTRTFAGSGSKETLVK